MNAIIDARKQISMMMASLFYSIFMLECMFQNDFH